MSSCSKEVWGCIAASVLAASFSTASIASPVTSKKLISNPVFSCQQTQENENFINYESGQVRPIALSADGSLLFVANTPANCLEIYSTKGKKLSRISAVQVGLEPVSVAVRNNHEVWVVNHLSDSISVVDIQGTPRIKKTLLVGDEPRDIVFAGPKKNRAFITTAHRGQNHSGFKLEDLRTPGISRADVWVFDAKHTGRELGGTPETILPLFADTPRALTVSADGNTVYAASFLSGNQTAVAPTSYVTGKKPEPNASTDGTPAPDTALIVRYNGSKWVDEENTDWSHAIAFNLPDNDVFEIDASASIPTLKKSYSHVGTTLFNMAVNPVSGAVYVSNTEARNEVRFEGPGTDSTTVRGHFAENRITVIKDDTVTPVHLNAHVDYSLAMGDAIPAEEKAKSLAQPVNMVVSKDGKTLIMSAFSSGRVALIDTKRLDKGKYRADASKQIKVPGGPTGLALSNNGKKLYVYSRFDNVVSVINLAKQKVRSTVALYNPEPAHVKDGRPILYDADYTSSNGTSSCGGCHIYGDADALAWDLGNPNEELHENLLEISPGNNIFPLKSNMFHPLKGPMTTQTFRGISDSGPMHWRGDRQGLNPVAGESRESAAFKEFGGAFVALVGRETELPKEDLQSFTDFVLSITSSPNPIRNLDNSLTDSQASGRDLYFNRPSSQGVSSCNDCHELDAAEKRFGTDGMVTNEGAGISQDFKVSQLRNMYQKVGMFGSSFLGAPHAGDQIRGFGYLHDGMVATLDDFVLSGAFEWEDDQQGRDVADFVLAFDTENPPIHGQQVTLSQRNKKASAARVDLLVEQAKQGVCSLAASGIIAGHAYYGVLAADGNFHAEGFPAFSDKGLRIISMLPKQQMTYTCLPKGLVAL
ncbi:hypothetical protein EDC56_2471 [Sinobacterium caligoides]|uniref:YVTN family beta-propeller protein n=1 Tax=Sinobacterium caligoides TaxID=933926 RepID=A0A3N2DQB3_9GAMM|nr:hypothetical protein [Sinobacterium caligoides]ROS02021.1 hypothetical protein EDC56_2471 [Sinobacterium caligoides]